MTFAKDLRDNAQLCDKVAIHIKDRIQLIGTETGIRPVSWKAAIQLEDDSVLEIRVTPCPDGCGGVQVVTSAQSQ